MPENHKLDLTPAFAAYGHVMARIGAFEQFMRIALAQREIDRCKASGKTLDTESFSKRLMRMDFGSLSNQICGKFKFDADLQQVLRDARGFRNNLAHQFWVTHFHNMHTDRGLAIILRECALLETQFERVASVVVSATGVDATAYAAFVAGNANRPKIFKEWEALLDRAETVMRETAPLMES